MVGGGFAGLYAAKGLAAAPVDVTLVDRVNHHLFQPLLYQVATGIIDEGSVAPALRSVLRDQANVEVLLAEVTGFDLAARTVQALAPDERPLTIGYDTLVVATGVQTDYFGRDDWAAAAPGLKSLEDARWLRSHILGAFEMAELAADPAERRAWLTFVVVGAGPTGVELTGEIATLAHSVLPKDFRNVSTREAQVILMDAGPTILPRFPQSLRRRAAADLRALGVEIRTNTLADRHRRRRHVRAAARPRDGRPPSGWRHARSSGRPGCGRRRRRTPWRPPPAPPATASAACWSNPT